MSDLINFGDLKLIGLDVVKLILNYLNKFYVIKFLKSSKSLYYNPKLRMYVINRFKQCKEFGFNNVDNINYNINNLYSVSIYIKTSWKENKSKNEVKVMFLEKHCTCKGCQRPLFNDSIVLKYSKLLKIYNIDFTNITNIKEILMSNEIFRFLNKHNIFVDLNNNNKIINLLQDFIMDIKKNCTITNNDFKSEFTVKLIC